MRDQAYETALNPEIDEYRRGSASMVYKFLDKKTTSGAETNVNGFLAQELHKPVIKKFIQRKGYARL